MQQSLHGVEREGGGGGGGGGVEGQHPCTGVVVLKLHELRIIISQCTVTINDVLSLYAIVHTACMHTYMRAL